MSGQAPPSSVPQLLPFPERKSETATGSALKVSGQLAAALQTVLGAPGKWSLVIPACCPGEPTESPGSALDRRRGGAGVRALSKASRYSGRGPRLPHLGLLIQ